MLHRIRERMLVELLPAISERGLDYLLDLADLMARQREYTDAEVIR